MSDPSSVHPPDPALIELVRSFPLPVAVLRLDGLLECVNERLVDCFGVGCLETASVRDVISRSEPRWRALWLRTLSGDWVEVRAQSIRQAAILTFVIDDTSDADCSGEVERLRHELVELEAQGRTGGATPSIDSLLDTELARSRRFRQPLSLLRIGIDDLSSLRAQHGNDAVLAGINAVWRALAGSVRLADLLLRDAGGEFLVVAPATDARHAHTLATGLRMLVERHHVPVLGTVTVSIGVAEASSGETREQWTGRTAARLAIARQAGGNEVSVDPASAFGDWSADGEVTTTPLIWSESLECGDAEVDHQHRALYALTNELIHASAVRPESAGNALAQVRGLLSSLETHFESEERLLDLIGYPFAAAHRLVHRDLLARAQQVVAEFEASGHGYHGVIEFLSNEVVANHVLGCDSDFFDLSRAHCAARA